MGPPRRVSDPRYPPLLRRTGVYRAVLHDKKGLAVLSGIVFVTPAAWREHDASRGYVVGSGDRRGRPYAFTPIKLWEIEPWTLPADPSTVPLAAVAKSEPSEHERIVAGMNAGMYPAGACAGASSAVRADAAACRDRATPRRHRRPHGPVFEAVSGAGRASGAAWAGD